MAKLVKLVKKARSTMTPDPELESALRRALRPLPPPGDLAPRVLAALAAPPRRPATWRWMAVAALCLLLAGMAALLHWRQQANLRQQAAAAHQLTQALRLAGDDLARVQRQVNHLSAR